jgi:hypothetical protein
MSFSIKELSRRLGRKVNLYLFRYGSQSASRFAYTNHTQPITSGGITYSPLPIKRGKIVVKGTMDKAVLEVRAALSAPIAELFRVYPPTQVVTLIIKQGHLSDDANEYKTCWAGRVTSARRDVNELVMSCEPSRTMLRRNGLRRFYQYSCPHELYGEKCGANKAAVTYGLIPHSINGLTIRLDDASTFPTVADQCLGGMVQWVNAGGETELRTIVRVTKRVTGVGTNTVSVSGNLRDLTEGVTIQIIAGCSHDKAGCAFHSNTENYGGCLYIPKVNPVGTTSLYY